MNESNLPWMICEALIVRGDSSAQLHYWDTHIDKLLTNYNTVGLRDLMLISYVQADREKFRTYWQTYSEHMRWYDPPGVTRREGTYEVEATTPEQYGCLLVAQCAYDCAGKPATVHHYFLRMGR